MFYLAGEVRSSLHRGAPPRVGSWSQEKLQEPTRPPRLRSPKGVDVSSVVHRSIAALLLGNGLTIQAGDRLPRCYRSRLTGPSAASASRADPYSLLRLKIASRFLHPARNLGFSARTTDARAHGEGPQVGGNRGPSTEMIQSNHKNNEWTIRPATSWSDRLSRHTIFQKRELVRTGRQNRKQ